jgi:hypothetical protein
MMVTSYQDYQVKFGGEDSSQTYIPYSIKNYLKNATSALVVRILGDGGWSFTTTTNKLAAVVLASTGSTLTYQIVSGLHPAKNNSSVNFDLRYGIYLVVVVVVAVAAIQRIHSLRQPRE